MKINDLMQFVDKTVIVRMNNGETAKVKVNFVDEEDEAVLAAVVETSSPDDYRSACAVFTFAAADITSIEISE